tara:strand:+ start:335 stop:589 length:255 start_codon:yes stop_codon:yes gene_type:complete
MVTIKFIYFLVIVNDNGLKYEKKANFRKISKDKKYFKNGQKKMSKIKKFFSTIKFQKKSLFEEIYFCYVITSQNKNNDFLGIFL